MKILYKFLLSMVIVPSILFSWEVNTHRLIDRKAIETSTNLEKFLKSINISLKNDRIEEKYLIYEEHPEETYLSYINKSGDAMADINLTFKNSIQNLIEAGTVLEDALRPGASTLIGVNGRFLNHFYNAKGQKSQRLLAFSVQHSVCREGV